MRLEKVFVEKQKKNKWKERATIESGSDFTASKIYCFQFFNYAVFLTYNFWFISHNLNVSIACWHKTVIHNWW